MKKCLHIWLHRKTLTKKQKSWMLLQLKSDARWPESPLKSSFAARVPCPNRKASLQANFTLEFNLALVIVQFVSRSNRPFAWSGHMVSNKLCWDANNAVGLPKQRTLTSPARLFFVVKVPLRYSCPSIIYFIPCDQIMQRVNWSEKTGE